MQDAGDPVEIAKAYDKAGADELVFSGYYGFFVMQRKPWWIWCAGWLQMVFIPFTVGGGIRTVEDFQGAAQGRGRQDFDQFLRDQ